MDAIGIIDTLKALGVPVGDNITELSSGNIQVPCPLYWRHSGGEDRHPSCSILINDDGPSLYHCFSANCGAAGTFTDLVLKVWRHNEKPAELADLVESVINNERPTVDATIKRITNTIAADFTEDLSPQEPEKEDVDVWPDEEIESYVGSVPKYAINRGIDLETAKAWQLGYDENRRRLVFPIRRYGDQALVGLTGRTITQGGYPKYFNYWAFRRAYFFYGEHLVEDTSKPMVLVEGPIDTVRVWQAVTPDYNVMGILGGTFTMQQREKLTYLAQGTVVLCFDNDDAGHSLTRVVTEALRDRDYTHIMIADLPDGSDPGDCDDDVIAAAIRDAGFFWQQDFPLNEQVYDEEI